MVSPFTISPKKEKSIAEDTANMSKKKSVLSINILQLKHFKLNFTEIFRVQYVLCQYQL
jgi:hypothetical protein